MNCYNENKRSDPRDGGSAYLALLRNMANVSERRKQGNVNNIDEDGVICLSQALGQT